MGRTERDVLLRLKLNLKSQNGNFYKPASATGETTKTNEEPLITSGCFAFYLICAFIYLCAGVSVTADHCAPAAFAFGRRFSLPLLHTEYSSEWKFRISKRGKMGSVLTVCDPFWCRSSQSRNFSDKQLKRQFFGLRALDWRFFVLFTCTFLKKKNLSGFQPQKMLESNTRPQITVPILPRHPSGKSQIWQKTFHLSHQSSRAPRLRDTQSPAPWATVSHFSTYSHFRLDRSIPDSATVQLHKRITSTRCAMKFPPLGLEEPSRSQLDVNIE